MMVLVLGHTVHQLKGCNIFFLYNPDLFEFWPTNDSQAVPSVITACKNSLGILIFPKQGDLNVWQQLHL